MFEYGLWPDAYPKYIYSGIILAALKLTSSLNKYDHYITKASKKYGISFPLLKAIINVESNFNPKAVSKAGAKGLMQIMPGNIRNLPIR